VSHHHRPYPAPQGETPIAGISYHDGLTFLIELAFVCHLGQKHAPQAAARPTALCPDRNLDLSMTPTTVELPDAPHVADQIDRWRAEHVAFAELIDGSDLPTALRQFGSACRNARQYDMAIEAFLAALTFAPGDVAAWRELASVYQIVQRDRLAEACALRSLTIDPDHAITWLQYASLAYKLQDHGASEAAYLRALSLDPTLGDADLGLGLLYLSTREFDKAIAHLRRSLTWGGADAVTYLCLGQSLYMAARFDECAEAFEKAATFAPLQGIILQLYARARTFASILQGGIRQALTRYPALAGAEAEPLDDVLRAAFSLFSAYGLRDAAITVARLRLESQPDDPVQRYLLAAVEGLPHDHAPVAYVEAHFDEFANGFDGKLVDVLGYRVPQHLADLVSSCRPTFRAMLDLGCGTGLAAAPLQRFGGSLAGIDLSAKMLALAARRDIYQSLIKSEAVDYLRTAASAFDLVFAADLLIYFGKLDEFIDAIADALMPGGIFAASIERSDAREVLLLPSGRFAHSAAYFESVVAGRFDIEQRLQSELRIEAGEPVSGSLYVMRLRC
jgi:predicted TPR repeat methyltransferase/Flp pilus assembly protein TadD